MFDIINTILQSSSDSLIPFLFLVSCILLLALLALGIPQKLILRFQTNDSSGDDTSARMRADNETEGRGNALNPTKQSAAILFIDLRDFHKLSADKQPEEVAIILNRFFDSIGTAVLAHNGWIDNYMGDGMLVVFGNEAQPEHSCKKAIKAVSAIRHALYKVNKELSKKIKQPLQMGIGMHAGSVLIAKLGHKKSMARRIVGPAVKIAYKLEELSKEKKVQIVMTVDLAKGAKLAVDNMETEYVVLKDHNIPVEVLCYSAKQKLPRV